VEWTYTYEPYGTKRSAVKNITTAPSNPMQYTGQRFDSGTSLSHLRARMYDSSTGRFLSQDPLAAPISAPYMSSYAYAGDNPTALVDPSGMASEGGDSTWSEIWDHPLASWEAGAGELYLDWKVGMPQFCASSPVRYATYFSVVPGGPGKTLLPKAIIGGPWVVQKLINLYMRQAGKPSPQSLLKVSAAVPAALGTLGTTWDVMCRAAD
jgi:RHS repeat-associated protein